MLEKIVGAMNHFEIIAIRASALVIFTLQNSLIPMMQNVLNRFEIPFLAKSLIELCIVILLMTYFFMPIVNACFHFGYS
ncbi:hypothetical protein BH10BAC4_BH10BAC4_20040 [soil metagenome]